MNLLFPLLLETIFVLLVVGITHQARRRFGLDLMTALVMLLILTTQWTADLGSFVTAGDFHLLFSSTVMFSGILLAIFLVFVFDGRELTKHIFIRLLAGELFYVGSILFLALIGQLPGFIVLNLDWAKDHIFSTVAVLADFYFITAIWSLMSRAKSERWLIFKVFFVFLGVCLLDSLIFIGGAFWGNPMQLSILRTGLISRAALALLITPFAFLYLLYEIKKYGASLEARSGWFVFDSPKQIEERLASDQSRILSLEELEVELEKKTQDLEKYRLAVDNAHDHIVITDADGIILYANDSVKRITGFDRSEILGKKAGSKDLWGGTMPLEFYKNFWKVVKTDKQPFTGELNNHRKNGKEYTALATVSPILDKAGNVIFFVAIERDISKEKEVDRMKSEFISMASHQLKSPIGALKWFCELLLEEGSEHLSKKQKELIGEIDKVSKGMLETVNALLNISRMESGRLKITPQPTQLYEIIDSLATEMEPEIKQNKIYLKIDRKKVPSINTDDKLLKEVYRNLISNAIKYSPAGAEVNLSIVKKGDVLISVVADHGYGIPQDEQERVFQKFFRAANVRQKEGTGLGLYLVKEIVEALGGKIWFESEEGKGCMFSFSLPLAGSKEKSGEVSIS